jgi:hypothetical protein
MTMNNDNTIWTNASLTPDLNPCVIWKYRSYDGVFSLPEARSKAMGLLQAAAVAQVEANIVTELAKVMTPKGFGQKQQREIQTVGLLDLVRKSRTPLIEGIESIFGRKSQQPLLNVHWYGEPMQFEMATASYHAEILLRTAEVAESDAFLRFFLSQQCDVPLDRTQIMIEDFALYRNQQSLEQLIGLE